MLKINSIFDRGEIPVAVEMTAGHYRLKVNWANGGEYMFRIDEKNSSTDGPALCEGLRTTFSQALEMGIQNLAHLMEWESK